MMTIDTAEFQSLRELFSVTFVLDRDLRVHCPGGTLQRHLPATTGSPGINELFDFARPRAVQTYDDIVARAGSLFLMTARDDSFAIRGQFVQAKEGGSDYLVFCGAPWLHWINTNRPDVKLGLSDFSAQDVQLDQLLYMATETNMVADLERLNTELIEAKHELEKAQADRNAFFAQMSHELRTPLNGVVSALALMKEEKLEGRAGEMLALAQKSSRNMLQVINYVLDIAKLESFDIDSDQVEFELTHLVESVIDIVRPRALEKHLDLRMRNNAILATVYRGDATALRQVLLNLLINAIKFTDEGGVSIDIDSGRSEGMTLRLEVADTGVGIAEEDQSRLFEPYSTSVEDSSAALGESTGLGLAIARRSVEAMGGDIGFISSLGGGSRFWVQLPLEPVEVDFTEPDAQPEPAADDTFHGRVLLVDDNETNLTLMSMILESMGVTVTSASSGEEAVEIALADSFELVLMDISMPGIDGFEATRRIRVHKPATLLPIIALTAYTGDEEQSRSREVGMDGYLTKPVESGPLAGILAQYLGRGDRAPEQALDGAGSPVDMETLEHLERQIGIKNLSSVIAKFGGEATRRWRALEDAPDNSTVAREAHTLASTCRSFGLPQVADELSAIEATAKVDQFRPAEADMAGLARRLEAQVTALQQAVSAMASGGA